MSRLHYKAEFVERDGQEVFYRYCPDAIYEKNTRGEFKFNLDDWKPIVINKAVPIGEHVYYIDEHCIHSLVSKIRKYFEENNELPNEVLCIA